ncbi:hypothetical protein SprV_0401480400 [Sparganum proliferum]
MRQLPDRPRESLALSDSDPGKSVANICRHRSSSKRGHELPPLLNDNKIFLIDDAVNAELFGAFFAKHLNTESEPAPFFHSPSDRTLSTIDVSLDLIKKQIHCYHSSPIATIFAVLDVISLISTSSDLSKFTSEASVFAVY